MLGLRTCAYQVPDLEAAKKWYSEAFGLLPYFDKPFYVGFNIGGYELGLLPVADNKGTDAENVLVYWGTENILTSYEHFIKLGATVHEEPHNVGGELEVATIRDPWGNIVGLIYNPYFKTE